MAAPIGKQQNDVIAEINIIPFVDIVLVLLIIFMVTSTAIVKAAIKVDLPKAAAAGSEVTATVNLVYTVDKELFLDGTRTTMDDARRLIAERVSESPKLQAVISADTKLPYGDVVEVVDLVKQAGVSGFALNIERKTVASK
ncbi:MAG: biopolymer transporter ExbD [Deltaproteobacteria bacterium]|nr:biopolymer transporter ExbD [Deltaproteobacteria bacterium]MBN2670364.1 biopolymer transporter ExbD [Deltaproteobacteria bacterium]